MLSPLFDEEVDFNDELQQQLDILRALEFRATAMFEHVPK